MPVSTTLNHIHLFDQYWNFIREIIPTTIPDNMVAWEVGDIENGDSANIEVSVTANSNATPGTPIVNIVEIGHSPGDDTYADNTSTFAHTLFGHGLNLHLSQRYWWNNDTKLNYQIDYSNVGDEIVSGAWITDDLLDNTTWNDKWNLGFDWNRIISQTQTEHQLRWQFSDIYPGDRSGCSSMPTWMTVVSARAGTSTQPRSPWTQLIITAA